MFFLGQPFNDDNTAGTDPHKTVFVGRLNFKTDEDRLKKEFEIFGHVKTVRIVRHHTTGKSKGYAFIEFQRERETDSKQLFSALILTVQMRSPRVKTAVSTATA